MGLPKPSAPTTSTTRWAFAGMTGLMRRVRLERQTPGAVSLNEHIVGEPRERVKGERRRAELSLGGRLPDADRAVRG